MGTSYGNSFDPRSLSPALWLSDTGSDPAVWEDLSGNGKNVTQATASAQPAIVASGMNGRQVRRFNGTSSVLSNTTAFLLPTAGSHSVFIVARVIPSGVTSQAGIQTLLDTSHNSFRNIVMQTRPDLGANRMTFGTVTDAIFAPNTPQIFSGVVAQNTSTLLAVNGVTYTGEGFTHVNRQGIYIGTWAFGSRFFSQDIAEILVFPTALSTSDRKSVENYLAKKWGIGFNPLSLRPALWLSDTGSNPAQWDDISGNNRHATQATVANQPAIIQNGLGGRQVRRFDGVNDFLSCGDVINARTGSISIYMVAKFANINTSLQTIIAKGRNAAGVGGRWLFFRSGGNLQGAASFANAATLEVVSVADSNTSWRLLNADFLRSNGTAISHVIRRNEVATIGASHTGSLTDFMLTNHLLIGAYNDGGSGGGVLAGSHLNGDIAEILVFPTALSTADRREVQRYLAQKWNIIP